MIFEVEGSTGYLITNHHVVEGSATVSVVVNDKTTYNGTVLGSDSVRDLAVVRICCGSYQAAPFGNASGLEAGTEVVTVGYALGLPGQATVTKGIVSAVRYAPGVRSEVIQTDAAINPGNSGGPMFSLDGEVLGINTFGFAGDGLGFAISGVTVQGEIATLKAGVATTPTPRPTATPSPGHSSDFGPTSGGLRHDPTVDFIRAEYANVSMADMVVEATFINPYDASSHPWDYGFMLRQPWGDEAFVQVIVTSGKRWGLAVGADAPYRTVNEGTVPYLNTGVGGRNHLRVIAMGERGLFFVNDTFVSTLDMSDVAHNGDVAVMTGAFTGDEVAGEVTRYEGFRVDQLTREYGPEEGVIQSDTLEDIGFHPAYSVRARDLIVEAEFVNPLAVDWDYGFMIRNPVFNRVDVIALTDDARWSHYTRKPEDSGWTRVSSGLLAEKDMRPGQRNSLVLVALQDVGWLLMNGEFVAKLDLSSNQDAGQVAAMAGWLEDNENISVEFNDFNVWVP